MFLQSTKKASDTHQTKANTTVNYHGWAVASFSGSTSLLHPQLIACEPQTLVSATPRIPVCPSPSLSASGRQSPTIISSHHLSPPPHSTHN
ncbi:MAG: hypothetical protein IPL25_20435 [Saprospiraceae bacterium]|nr:hypothetical protein [Candidatus Vicinibacter affinis]